MQDLPEPVEPSTAKCRVSSGSINKSAGRAGSWTSEPMRRLVPDGGAKMAANSRSLVPKTGATETG